MIEPKVIFATDLDGDMRRGLSIATRLAADRVATLVILGIQPMRTEDGEGMLHQSLELMARRPQLVLAGLVPSEPGIPYVRLFEVGEPEHIIPRIARRERAAFVVMETPRRRFGSWLGKNIVERVAAEVDCPVVTFSSERASTPKKEAPSSQRGVVHVPKIERLEMLRTLLDARVEALVTWLDQRKDAVHRIAASEAVRDAIATIERGSGPLRERVRATLGLAMAEHERALGAVGLEVIDPHGQLLFASGVHPRADVGRERFLQAIARDGAAVSLPLDADGSGPDDACVILAGAAVPIPGAPPAILSFTFDARRDFLRILAQPGPTPSTETYAFDADGLMLSNSRFPEELVALGLLPRDANVQTTRRVRVCEPTHPQRDGAPRPLTRMAADAIAGHDGGDAQGYRDYRGVPVLGVWRWVDSHGFGVAAEMDRDDSG